MSIVSIWILIAQAAAYIAAGLPCGRGYTLVPQYFVQAEAYLLEYVSTLAPHRATRRVAAEYLAWCTP